MKTIMTPALAALALLAGPAAAAGPEGSGRWRCVLSSQGACGEGPDGICLGARIRRGHAPVVLDLDFSRGKLSLNGLEARLLPPEADSSRQLVWDLALLGTARLAPLQRLGKHIFATLSSGPSTALFGCTPRG